MIQVHDLSTPATAGYYINLAHIVSIEPYQHLGARGSMIMLTTGTNRIVGETPEQLAATIAAGAGYR